MYLLEIPPRLIGEMFLSSFTSAVHWLSAMTTWLLLIPVCFACVILTQGNPICG